MIPPIWLWLHACIRPEDPAPVPAMTTLGADFEAHQREIAWTDRPVVADLGGAWQARAGRVRAYLLSDTTWIVDRAQSAPTWRVGLTATALGRGDTLRELGAGTTFADGPSFERVRDGLVEWFSSRPEGLEHGFTVLDRPPGEGPLVLEIDVKGAEPVARPDGASFQVGGRTKVEWRGLLVADADRHALPASVSVAGSTLRVTVDDAGARWPVVIDPLLTVPTTTRDVTGAGPTNPSWAGFSIDSDGEQIVIGNPGNVTATDGAAYVLERNLGSADTWAAAHELTGADEDRLGYSVAIDAGTIAVATSDDIDEHVYVYRNDGTSWNQEGSISATDIGLGTSMDLEDDTLVVGAPDAASAKGEVHVFTRYASTGTWEAIATLQGQMNGVALGTSVSISGDGFVAGAPGNGGDNDGRAFVYRFNTDGSDPASVARFEQLGTDFGKAVAMDGDVVAVASPSEGRVFLYHRTSRTAGAEVWDAEGEAIAPPNATARFGSALALWGDTLAVTDLPLPGNQAQVHLFERRAQAWAYVESFDAGEVGPSRVPVPVTLGPSLLAVGLAEDPDAAVQVWHRDHGGWLEEDTDVAWDIAFDADFGSAVAVSGDRVVVGAPNDDELATDVGAVATYIHDDHGSWTLADVRTGVAQGERYGAAVAVDGDLTLVGAPGDGVPVVGGRAQILSWDGAEHTLTADLLGQALASEGAGLRWGEAVAINQLFAVVGAPGRGSSDQGAAWVFGRNRDGPDAWGQVAGDLAAGTNSDAQMGATVGLAGGTVLVGSPSCNGPAGISTGCLNVYDLTLGFPLLQTLAGDAAHERLGRSIAVDGDLMAVGVSGFASNDGQVRIYQMAGGPDRWNEVARIDPQTAGRAERFGYRLALSGDLLYISTLVGDSVEIHARNGAVQDDWALVETLQGSAAGSRFGESLAADRDCLVIGEPWLTASPEPGRVFLMQRDAEHDPVARDDVISADEGEDYVAEAPGLVGNDYDPDGDAFTANRVTDPIHGTIEAFGIDGTFTYRPTDPDWFGTDSFVYAIDDGTAVVQATVLINVANVPDPPVARPDGPYVTAEEMPIAVPAVDGVLANDDDDIDGGVIVRAEEVGIHLTGLTLNPNGSFTYFPPADFFGEVSFDYVARDGDDLVSDPPTTVVIVVTPRNDAPVAPSSLDAFTGLSEDTPFLRPSPGLIDPAYGIHDPDGDVIWPVLTAPPASGSVAIDAFGGWRYTPAPDFHGTDDFEYAVSDGQEATPVRVVLVVDEVNDPPTAVDDGPYATEEEVPFRVATGVLLANDSDVEPLPLRALLDTQPTNGMVTYDVLEEEVVYTPDPGWSGADSFTYRTIDDGGLDATATVRVVVAPIDDRPVAEDDDLGQVQDPVTANVLANDHDEESPTLTAQLGQPPVGGDVSLAEDGTATYTPRADFVGEDSFTYVAADATGNLSETAVVRVVVVPGPTDTDPPATTPEDTGCVATTWFHDADGDGFGDDATAAERCIAPQEHVATGGDCDDERADVFPDAVELPDDRRDQDCDGLDNLARPAGACDTSGGAGALAAGLVLLLLRRRGAA